MLEEVCNGFFIYNIISYFNIECLLPIMKSKKGIKICVGCEDKKE
jgi:hypothetical protein